MYRYSARKITQFTLVSLLAGMISISAQAHSTTTATMPANGAVIAALDVIELQFDGPMRVTAIALAGPQGDVAITPETGAEPATTFRANLPANLPEGPYNVDWRGLSSDGHVMQGRFSFTVAK